MADHERTTPYVKLGASICGIAFVMVIIFAIFARDYLNITIPIVWAFVVLGIVLGFFQLKSDTKSKGK